MTQEEFERAFSTVAHKVESTPREFRTVEGSQRKEGSRLRELVDALDKAFGVRDEMPRVLHLNFVDMIPRGGLVPVAGGFDLYLQRESESSLDLVDPGTQVELTPRERFVVAHELAHTLFFDLAKDPPSLLQTSTDGPALEKVCDEVASQLLVPSWVLRDRLRRLERISAEMVTDLAREFAVSVQVMVRRLAKTDSVPGSDVALILAYPSPGWRDAEIRGVCYGASMLPLKPRPAMYGSLKAWCGELVSDDLFHPGNREWVRWVGTREIR
jgi:hypothetical protein